MTDNPYSAPKVSVTADSTAGRNILAGRLMRLAACQLDFILVSIVAAAAYLAATQIFSSLNQLSPDQENTALTLLACSIFTALNSAPLHYRGQTIGKLLMRIQIVDKKTATLPPFYRGFGIRHLWPLPIYLVITLLANSSVAFICLLTCYTINYLTIIGEERRCLHDYLANTTVVEFHINRC